MIIQTGLAADHGGYSLKEFLKTELVSAGFAVVDFGAAGFDPDDDYPNIVLPLADAVARGEVDRGIAVCGSGVGACIAANKVPGVRAALVTECYSARQGVEDDDMNLLCLGGLVIGTVYALELVMTFLNSRFKGTDRYRRRLKVISDLEKNGSHLISRDNRNLHEYME